MDVIMFPTSISDRMPPASRAAELSPHAAVIYTALMEAADGLVADLSVIDRLDMSPAVLRSCWMELHERALLVLVDHPSQQRRVLLSGWAGGFLTAAHDGAEAVYDDDLTPDETKTACSSLRMFREYVQRGRNMLHGAERDLLAPTRLDWTQGLHEGRESGFTGLLAVMMAERDVRAGHPIRLPQWWALEAHLSGVFGLVGTELDVVLTVIRNQVANGEL